MHISTDKLADTENEENNKISMQMRVILSLNKISTSHCIGQRCTGKKDFRINRVRLGVCSELQV